MTFVFDTEVLVDHQRLQSDATGLLRRALRSERRVAASVMTRVEVRQGSRPHQAAGIVELDVFVDWVPVDHVIARRAAEHAQRFDADPVRCVVAATAERLDATLLTRHPREFPMFPDLEPAY